MNLESECVMDTYIDITVLPDLELSEPVLMNHVFAKLHRVLGKNGGGQVGVSFPHHKKTLGDIVRLHGQRAVLESLANESWLQGLRDYTVCSGVQTVPQGAAFRTVRRSQVKSAYNKRKRSIKKGWLTENEALARIPDSQQKTINLPYLQMRSLSNRNMMRVYIEHGPVVEHPSTGGFSSYGLSRDATVPWF